MRDYTKCKKIIDNMKTIQNEIQNNITFNINNLNSKKSEKFFYHIYNNWHREITIKIFKNHEEYWKVEDPSIRANLPKFKVIPGKKENFLPGRKIEEMEINLSNWPRSHIGKIF